MNDLINSHEAIRMVEDAVTVQMRGGYGNTSLLLAYEEVIRLAKIGEHAERIKELPTAQPDLQQTCNQLATVAKDTNVPTNDCISRQTAIDALEQPERKKGKWIHYDDGDFDYDYKCSECGCAAWDNSDFCPNCGADMRGEEHETD